MKRVAQILVVVGTLFALTLPAGIVLGIVGSFFGCTGTIDVYSSSRGMCGSLGRTAIWLLFNSIYTLSAGAVLVVIGWLVGKTIRGNNS